MTQSRMYAISLGWGLIFKLVKRFNQHEAGFLSHTLRKTCVESALDQMLLHSGISLLWTYQHLVREVVSHQLRWESFSWFHVCDIICKMQSRTVVSHVSVEVHILSPVLISISRNFFMSPFCVWRTCVRRLVSYLPVYGAQTKTVYVENVVRTISTIVQRP